GVALDEGADERAVAFADQEVALPVAGHRPVGDLRWAFRDRDHAGDPALPGRPAPWFAARAAAAQVAGQVFAQPPPGLHVERLVDRLRADPQLLVVWVLEPQSGRDLPGRKAPLEHPHHLATQPRARHKLRPLRPRRPKPGAIIGNRRPITSTAANSPDLAADRRRRPPKPPSDRTERLAGRDPRSDLLPLQKRQPKRRPRPAPRPPRRRTARLPKHLPNRPAVTTQTARHLNTRLTTRRPLQHLKPLPLTQRPPHTTTHHPLPPIDTTNPMLRRPVDTTALYGHLSGILRRTGSSGCR